jgi:hypothetical protein
MKFKYVLFFIFYFLLNTLYARCVKDIYVGGVSFDSIAYTGSFENGANATLASKTAIGVKGAWIVYCPKIKLELQSYFRLRNYNFAEKDLKDRWNGVDSNIALPSIGLEGRKSVLFFDNMFDLAFDLELRKELGFGIYPGSQMIFREDYSNFKVQLGLRYYLWRKKRHNITVMGKIGPLFPVSGGIDPSVGILYGISGEYYLKINKKLSLRFDLYYDSYKQDFGILRMERVELGVRSNIVFRL